MLAGLHLAQRGRQPLGRHDGAHGRDLRRREEPGGGTGEQAGRQEVGDRQDVEQATTASEA